MARFEPLARLVAISLLLARRAGSQRVGLVLLYHRVAPAPGELATELVPAVSADAFAAQMAWLCRWYAPVPAGEILGAAGRRRRGGRLPVAVTFDDDSPTYARWSLPIVRRAGLPATFFVSGASLDAPHAFWWERLQAAVDAGLPTDELTGGGDVHAKGAAIERLSAADRDAVGEALARLGAEPRDVGLSVADLRELARDQDVGFHTLRHHPLTSLDEDELREALTEGRGRLEAEVGRPLELIAYPNGAAGEREARAARAAGFRLGFTTAADPCGPGTNPLRIGRAELGHAPLGVFALRVERLLGRG